MKDETAPEGGSPTYAAGIVHQESGGPSTPALVIEIALEEPVQAYSTARTEGEQIRLEDDLRARGEAVLEHLADVLMPEVRWAA